MLVVYSGRSFPYKKNSNKLDQKSRQCLMSVMGKSTYIATQQTIETDSPASRSPAGNASSKSIFNSSQSKKNGRIG
jgi:hypothetical protein